MQNSLITWLQTYSWQIIFLLVLFLIVCVPFFLLGRRLIAILGQQNLWLDLEQTITEITPKACQYYPNPSRHILMSVLTQEKGVVQASAVSPALDYLAAELDSPISIVRSLSYLSILVGLLGTVSLLALALQSVDTIGQFRIDQLKNIYPLNAVAIGLAVLIFLSYSWWRHQGDQFLLQVSRYSPNFGPISSARLIRLCWPRLRRLEKNLKPGGMKFRSIIVRKLITS